ncbi:MAG: hypothetical protein AAB425_06250 [Bdellovibrionota bacterium]
MRKSAASIAVVILTFGCAALARGAEIEHLGAPPPGNTLIEFRSAAATAPIQFMGTADPPSALMNGSPLKLEDWPDSPEQGPGQPSAVWLDSVPIPVEGEVGRFFQTLPPSAAAKPELLLAVRDRAGHVKRSLIQLNRCFLDAPITLQATVPVEWTQETGRRFEFRMSGQIPRGSRIVASDIAVRESAPGMVELLLNLPLGNSVLAAKIENSDGSVRLLNIPFQVVQTEAKPDATILSIEVPDDFRAGEAWDFSPNGTRLKGLTSHGMRLAINGTRVPLTTLGRFSWYYYPQPTDTELLFSVTGPDGRTDVFRKKVHCTECSLPPSLTKPRYRKPGESYVSLSLFGPTLRLLQLSTGPSSLTYGMAFAPAFEFGNFARHDLTLSGGFRIDPFANQRNLNDGAKVRQAFDVRLAMQLDYFIVPRWSLGIGAQYGRIHAVFNPGTSEESARTEQNLALRIRTGLRFSLGEAWDWQTRLEATLTVVTRTLYETKGKWTEWLLEPLVLRRYF